MIYNLARNPIGTVPNALLASASGKELHPPILITPAIHGGQVKRERVHQPSINSPPGGDIKALKDFHCQVLQPKDDIWTVVVKNYNH